MLLLSSTSNTMTGRLNHGDKLRLIFSSIPTKLLILKLRTYLRKFVTSRVTTLLLKRLRTWVLSYLWSQLFTLNLWKTVTGPLLNKLLVLCSTTTLFLSTLKIFLLSTFINMKTLLMKLLMLPKRKLRLKRSLRTSNNGGANKFSNSLNIRKPRLSLLLIL